MPDNPTTLADQLLDLQVEWVIGELTGPRFAEVVARDVDDLLRIARDVTVDDLVDRDALKTSLRRLADALVGSTLVGDAVVSTAEAVYELPASAQHLLGDVVDRESVEALIDAVLAMNRLHDRAMERMAESPQAGAIAGRFVTKLVGDVLAQNRQLAEKVPGVSSLFSIGLGAANKVRSATIDQFLGDATGKGGQFAVRRTNSALRDMIRDAAFKGAAMEFWDLHADEPISELREYLSGAELRDVVALVHELVTSVGGTEFAGEALDACVDAVLDAHAGQDVATLMDSLGIAREDVVDAVVTHGTTLLAAAHERGELEKLARARLAPFFALPEVRALLGGPGAAPRP